MRIYAQAHSFAQVSLNTSVLGLGPEKDYGGRVGAPLGRTAAVWINGAGFYNYQVRVRVGLGLGFANPHPHPHPNSHPHPHPHPHPNTTVLSIHI